MKRKTLKDGTAEFAIAGRCLNEEKFEAATPVRHLLKSEVTLGRASVTTSSTSSLSCEESVRGGDVPLPVSDGEYCAIAGVVRV